jgi:hypothetical protein
MQKLNVSPPNEVQFLIGCKFLEGSFAKNVVCSKYGAHSRVSGCGQNGKSTAFR